MIYKCCQIQSVQHIENVFNIDTKDVSIYFLKLLNVFKDILCPFDTALSEPLNEKTILFEFRQQTVNVFIV